ncbi:MAG: multidrug effflux MFS transporter [Rhodobiaceae bacterium]|nr:multidrug effflux MFS transporter [Rhodobiaceae bacterium]
MTQSTPRKNASTVQLIALVILISSLAPIGLNIPLPALPAIARSFGVDYGIAQYTVTIYLISVAVGQLIYGPLADRFGRKPVMIAGLLIYVAGCLAAYYAPNAGVLIVARGVQALGGCAGIVVGRAMVRDMFDHTRAASVLSYITVAIVIAPMISPAVGGFIEETSGWRFIFLATALFALPILVWGALIRTETRRQSERTAMLHGMSVLIRIKSFLISCAILGCSGAVFYTYVAGAPLLCIEGMGVSPAEFGVWQMSMAASYSVGSFLSGRYVSRLGSEKSMLLGSSIAVACTIGTAIALHFFPDQPLALFGPTSIMSAGLAFAINNSTAVALSTRPQFAGAAAGLAGFTQMGLGGFAVLVIGRGFKPDGSIMLWSMIGFSICALLVQFLYRKHPTSYLES